MFKKSIAASLSLAIFSTVTALSAFAEETAASDKPAQGGGMMGTLLFMAPVIIILLFLMGRPQKKREKEAKMMQENLQVGDEIVTIGGIVGLVVRKGQDNIVIETGGDKSKIRIKPWAVSENLTAKEKLEAQKAEMKKNRGMTAGGEKVDDTKKKTKLEKEKSE